MKHHFLLKAAFAAILLSGAAAALAPGAKADSDEYFAPVADETVKAECSACHMAFPPSMLPAQSWQAIMDDLGNHFGEDASLEDQTRTLVAAYLVDNAAGAKSRIAKSVAKNETPVLRISDMPWWVRAHKGEVNPADFESPKVKTKANCAACHRGAEQGYFED